MRSTEPHTLQQA